MSEEKLQRAGQFVLDVCILHTSGEAVFDLKGGANVMKIDFHEDIMTPYVQGTIVIQNQGSASNIGPIIGQETLELKIRTPTLEKPHEILDYTGNNRLYITRVNNKRRLGGGTEIISLEFFSGEWVRNSQTKVSSSMTGSVSSIVDNMLNKVHCLKVRYIEPSAETKNYIAPNIRPFDVVNHLMPQATSGSGGRNPENSYLFWENKQGYHFRSLASIYRGSTDYSFKGTPVHKYISKIGSGDGVVNGQVDVFQQLHVVKDFNTTHSDNFTNHVTGALGSNMITHDMYNKTYSSTTFNYLNKYDSFSHTKSENRIKSNPIHSESIDFNNKRISDHVSKSFLYPEYKTRTGRDAGMTDSHGRYTFTPYRPDTWLQKRRGHLGILFNGITVEMYVHGNTFLNAGDLIDFTLPYFGIEDASRSKKTDKFINGNMLVTKITHSFDVSEFEHEMKLICVTDDLDEELDHSVEQSTEGEMSPKHTEVYDDFYDN